MSRRNQISSIAVLVLQLCSVAFLEFGHTDSLIGDLRANQTLSSHDCGARERHKDIDSTHFCQACYRAANSVAKISMESFSRTSFTEILVRRILTLDKFTDFYTSASKRGPPLFVS